ncbi:MAG: thymidine kinase [Bacteroidota bacterium]|jgi:thymidine kinase
MFLENHKPGTQRRGWIEVVCGSMFSGKTEELLRRLKRARIASQKVMIFKPSVDNRYDENKVVSHDSNATTSLAVRTSNEILNNIQDCEVIGIDEAQFFDTGIIDVCNTLASNGKRVIVAGLDMDFQGKPFGPMPSLMACAEYVTKVHAICVNCGNLAHISHRKNENRDLVLVGELESYEPLCRECYNDAVN